MSTAQAFTADREILSRGTAPDSGGGLKTANALFTRWVEATSEALKESKSKSNKTVTVLTSAVIEADVSLTLTADIALRTSDLRIFDQGFEDWIFYFSEPDTVSSLDDLRAELDEFANLDPNWDGHGAAPISRAACEYAWRFLQELPEEKRNFEPYPEPDGSVGFECHKDNKSSMYLSFSPVGEIAYVAVFKYESGAEEVHRGSGLRAGSEIPSRIRELIDDIA